jgi:hypothetical protein
MAVDKFILARRGQAEQKLTIDIVTNYYYQEYH